MVAVFGGGVGGLALALCLWGLAGPPRTHSEDESRLLAAQIGTQSGQLIAFLRRQVPQAEQVAAAKDLIAQLKHESFRAREAAAIRLVQMGPVVAPLLKQAKAQGDLETQRRADKCLQAISQANDPAILESAIRLLVSQRAQGASPALLDYLPFAANEEIADQTVDAILALGLQHGPNLEGALKSKYAERRAVAARLLAQRGSPNQVESAKKLLSDEVALVRLGTAEGLVARGDRGGVATLIALVAHAEPIGAKADDILLSLAGEAAPPVVWANDPATRRRSLEAWREWWQQNEKKIILAQLLPRPQGPAARARFAAQQFLGALAKGDFATFKRNADIPFHLGGLLTFTAVDDFDDLFRQIVEQQKNDKKELSFRILGMGSFDELRNNLVEADRQSLKALDSRKVQVVFVQGRIGAEPFEKGAVLVRLTPARALVVGIYEMRSKD